MECMICYEEAGDAGFMDPNPCSCRGTMRIHEACLARIRTQYSKCPACCTPYPEPPLVFENGLAKIVKMDNIFRMEYTVNEARQKHGTETTYMDGIKVEEIEWVNGDQHGITRRWYENGQLEAEEEWEHDLPHGTHNEWHENGVPSHKEMWQHGHKTNLEYYWHENGRIESVISWHNNMMNGPYKSYSKRGQLVYQSYWYNGEQHGLEIFYHSNGQVERKVQYVLGKKNGIEQQFNEDGILVHEFEWENDRVTPRRPMNGFRAWLQIGI